MRRLLALFVIGCTFAAGCGGDSDTPAESDECAGDECDTEDGNDTDANDSTADTSPTETVDADGEPTDDVDLEPEDDVNTDLVVAAVAEAWGVDEDLARCVVEELSLDDPAAIDPAAVDDPTKEICGTTLLELMINAG